MLPGPFNALQGVSAFVGLVGASVLPAWSVLANGYSTTVAVFSTLTCIGMLVALITARSINEYRDRKLRKMDKGIFVLALVSIPLFATGSVYHYRIESTRGSVFLTFLANAERPGRVFLRRSGWLASIQPMHQLQWRRNKLPANSPEYAAEINFGEWDVLIDSNEDDPVTHDRYEPHSIRHYLSDTRRDISLRFKRSKINISTFEGAPDGTLGDAIAGVSIDFIGTTPRGIADFLESGEAMVTPIRGLIIERNRYTIRATKEGYLAAEEEIEVKDDDIQEFSVSLRPDRQSAIAPPKQETKVTPPVASDITNNHPNSNQQPRTNTPIPATSPEPKPKPKPKPDVLPRQQHAISEFPKNGEKKSSKSIGELILDLDHTIKLIQTSHKESTTLELCQAARRLSLQIRQSTMTDSATTNDAALAEAWLDRNCQKTWQ